MKERLWYACVYILCAFNTASRLAVTGSRQHGKDCHVVYQVHWVLVAKSLKVLNTCLELWAGACEVWSFLLCQGLCNLLVKVMTVLLEKVVMFVTIPRRR